MPQEFALGQNAPNPFNPTTIINYQLPVESYVTIKIYNMLGQEVATLVDELQSAGYKTARFNGSELSSGVYFYRMTAYPSTGSTGSPLAGSGSPSTGSGQGFSESKKLVLVK